MIFFGSAKDSFNGFFSSLIKFTMINIKSIFFALVDVGLPNMPGNHFHMAFTMGTL
jgi:hypothetical protein